MSTAALRNGGGRGPRRRRQKSEPVVWCRANGMVLPDTLLMTRADALVFLKSLGLSRRMLSELRAVQLRRQGQPHGRAYYVRRQLAARAHSWLTDAD